ncbi:hypothetical protein Q0590_17815 [Rhodocytophaga aerolata]|uniref:Outer membrane beta-barrel protein n=1 Tax=Rhodocytophaga aerolata TaxID=455078 RepID=A0ABT8R8U8_9BACT|nr:hypothetical protein [Rhodocytophaga aerolata]MDO1448136.1 hypothetical protein [Rhodocytophaga aerolata]
MRLIHLFFYCILLLSCQTAAWAQEGAPIQRNFPVPVTLSVFSQAISLPNFKGFFTDPQLGIRLGTELNYRKKQHSQVFQTINLAYYSHKSLHRGFYLSSEVGYRKHFGSFFLDATIGGGYLHLISTVPVYKATANGDFVKASAHFHKFMPTLGVGTGYRITNATSLFARYEVFGEMPIQQSVPILPHKALHVGMRIHLPTKN